MKIFGVPVEGWSLEKIIERVQSTNVCTWIVTANPEILLEARQDREYMRTLLQADLRTVDGVGLKIFGLVSDQAWVRVTGVELAERLIQLAAERDWKVGFFGGDEGAARISGEKWQKIYPGLSIWSEQGGRVEKDGSDHEAGEEARHRLTIFAPDILLVAFGHPKQERWIRRYMADFPSLKVVVGVGGVFDYWAGHVLRAPVFLQKAGLEWLWRLILQPWRIGRIFRAVIVFPVLVVIDRIRSK